MKKAICLPYCCDQNEPSIPLKQIVTLPDNVAKRNKLLKKLFVEHVCDAELKELTVRKGKPDDYGDLFVSYGDEVYMFVTFIKE